MSNFDAFADFRMDGHVAIVTGGAQNIGEAIAKTFSGAGAKVMIADLDGEKAQATAEAIQAVTGNQVLGIGCNVTVEEDIQPTFRTLNCHRSKKPLK
ncbi:MAG: SDR family NAD(P)-dependent oxidoreductase [Microcystis sp.]|jgi:NAD(P)-dependent dehydrogenase (short-subunit alcohol dehydrogenase family)